MDMFKNLTKLKLDYINDDLSVLPNLTHLTIPYCNDNNNHYYKKLSKIKNLTHLTITEPQESELDVISFNYNLHNLQHLEYLSIQGNLHVSDIHMIDSLEILNIDGDIKTSFSTPINLQKLQLNGTTPIKFRFKNNYKYMIFDNTYKIKLYNNNIDIDNVPNYHTEDFEYSMSIID
jgi:hypothetical protein